MAYEIVLTNTARNHYRELDARWKASVKEGLEPDLRHEPAKVSKSPIKRLRDMRQPEYRLRVSDYRISYDIDSESQRVVVAAIVLKGDADRWLLEHGVLT
jgi:mRNA interferase RelE/StbE